MSRLPPHVYAQNNGRRFLAELQEFVRFPSVSSQPTHAPDVKRCAEWLAAHLRGIGLQDVRVIATVRHPLVYAEWRRAPGRPTVLIYGHYDVQPADPLSEWHTPPFAPTVRGNDLFGRGACDDKGQLFAHVKALESYLRTAGRLPVNVKCLFEGEEEIGSPNLQPFIARRRRALAANVAVMSDTRMLGPDRPALTISLRGGLGLELEVRGPQRDLHSGNFGGAVHNPLQALCDIISQLHDECGRIAIPEFYDRVRHWPDDERARMASTGPSDADILRDAKTRRPWGEDGFSLYERTTIRPALTVNGITGGYQGPGGKAVIPSRATAKISFRLVPDQDPRQIERLVREHLRRITPPTVESEVRTLMRAEPAVVDHRQPAMRAASQAYRQAFGARPVLVRSGGTIPVVNMFQQLLDVPTVLMGFALPDDRIHAPNEKFHLPNFHRGIETCIRFLAEIGTLSETRRAAIASVSR
jgi:acetylornithine deacetylase/succinyl-diaminopimelate desuccinylase-like protein